MCAHFSALEPLWHGKHTMLWGREGVTIINATARGWGNNTGKLMFLQASDLTGRNFSALHHTLQLSPTRHAQKLKMNRLLTNYTSCIKCFLLSVFQMAAFHSPSVPLTEKIPLSIGRVAGEVNVTQLQVHWPTPVRPGAKFELASLNVKGEPTYIDVAGALQDRWWDKKRSTLAIHRNRTENHTSAGKTWKMRADKCFLTYQCVCVLQCNPSFLLCRYCTCSTHPLTPIFTPTFTGHKELDW